LPRKSSIREWVTPAPMRQARANSSTPANASRLQVVGNVQYKVPQVPGLKLHGAARYFGPTYVSDDNLLSVPGRTVFTILLPVEPGTPRPPS